jgi:hypothetical protein
MFEEVVRCTEEGVIGGAEEYGAKLFRKNKSVSKGSMLLII